VYRVSQLSNDIISLCIAEPKPISQIIRATQKNYNTVYASIQRAAKKGLLHTEIIDGLLWVRTVPPKQQLDLLRESQKSNTTAKTSHQNEIPLCGPERLEAIHLTRSRINIKSIEDECYNLFDTYNERVKDAIICLLPNPEHDFLGPPLELPYKTRFNDEGRKVEELNHYEEAWEEATKRHRRAVMVTLTTDPKIQESLWDGNRKQSGNLNRLLSNLSRKFKGRPTYISVNEFQGNGRIHLHLVIFGRSYIMGKQQLSHLWAKYGQGEIVDFKKLKKDRQGWIWDGEKPQDSNGKNPEDYLKKYLKKGLYNDETSYQYWVYNTRYFTHTRSLREPQHRHRSRGQYVFFGVFYDQLPEYGNHYQETIQKVERLKVRGRKLGETLTDGGLISTDEGGLKPPIY
jgi:hypothetical protein